jgi:adenylate cyclase
MASFFKKMIRFRPVYIGVLAALAGMVAYFNGIPFLDLMELKTIDLRFQSRGAIQPRPEVVLAVVDEKSLAREGKWVWPRSKFVKLVDAFSSAGARVVAFDIGFLEPDNLQLMQTVEEIEKALPNFAAWNGGIEGYFKEIKSRCDNDLLLADALKRSSARIVLGYFFHTDIESAAHFDEGSLETNARNLQGTEYKQIRFASKEAQNVRLVEAFAPESNIAVISRATPYAGSFSMMPDPDGVIRKIPAVFKFRDELYAPLSLIAACAYLNQDISDISVDISQFGIDSVRMGSLLIPTDEYGNLIVNYRGGPKTFPHISITDILQGKIPDSALKDKIVLVGATATGVYDLRVTPFASVYPGLEIHANVIDSVLSGDFLNQPEWGRFFDVFAVVVSGLFLGLVLPGAGVSLGALTAAAVFAGYVFICYYFFAQKGWILNMVYPLTVTVLVYVCITAYKYLVEARQKRFIRGAFSTYLAPSVVKQLIESPEKLVLGGEQRDITAFFSDVQGFTSISEKLTPTELVELLNEFLTEMTNIILEHEGTVDKFEGDAIIAFFGAPMDLPNHAEIACRACIRMQKRLSELRRVWIDQNRPALKMRIGLCTGTAVVGNMGSRNRMDYTMMGDTVNTAARLEGINKIYGVYTLISDATYHRLNGNIVTREVDSINVVGKDEPVTIYELLGYPEDMDPTQGRMLEHYSEGLKAYRGQEWKRAVESFEAALSVLPEDGPSRVLLARTREFQISPPAQDWNGSFTMRTK